MTRLIVPVADANIECPLDIANAIPSRKQNKILDEHNRMLERLIELMEK